MKKGLLLILSFGVWTALLKFVDVAPIGPNGSAVGFSVFNQFVHRLTGVHMSLYTVTDWLGLVPVCFALSFGLLGLIQWIKRKHILKVDKDILILGGYYIVVFFVYFLFEYLVINYRPILINGVLEASYPSSTTMLTLCVMPTAITVLKPRVNNKILNIAIIVFTAFMVIGRLISGVHWATDIIGGILLGFGMVSTYNHLVKE